MTGLIDGLPILVTITDLRRSADVAPAGEAGERSASARGEAMTRAVVLFGWVLWMQHTTMGLFDEPRLVKVPIKDASQCVAVAEQMERASRWRLRAMVCVEEGHVPIDLPPREPFRRYVP